MSTSIQFSPFTSIFENKSAGTIIIGKPGSGKTFFLLNLMANAIMMEQRVFMIDPKDDGGVLADVFPDDFEYIDINNINPGALNPFKVINNLDTNTLVSIISIICGGFSNEESVAVTPIVNDFVNQNRFSNDMSFSNIVDYLYSNDNIYAQTVGTKLQIHRDSKYGPLLFGTNTSDKTNNFLLLGSSSKNKSKIISLHGMNLPKTSSGQMTEEQKFNSAVVYIICRMLKDILTEGKYPTLFVLDEAHIAFQNPSFASIIDEFLILGRSLNVATLLASQSVSHYPKTITQLIASKFCFKSSTQEASDFLRSFYNQDSDDLADFDSIVYTIGQFNTGECLLIDDENRSGIFKVTSLMSENITSNPLLKKRKNKKEGEE